MSNMDTSADAVERLAAASNDHADDCESNAETHDDLGNRAHAAAFREMVNHHLDTAATLRAILAERDGQLPPGWVAVKRDLLESLCDDVEAAVKQTHGEPPHPALMHRYNRDMGDVQEARRLLAAAPRPGESA